MEGRSHFEGQMWSVSVCAEWLMLMPNEHSATLKRKRKTSGRLVLPRLTHVFGQKALKPQGHYGRVVKATDSNYRIYLFPSGSAGSNPAGVDFF
jgi:hypothetical protein